MSFTRFLIFVLPVFILVLFLVIFYFFYYADVLEERRLARLSQVREANPRPKKKVAKLNYTDRYKYIDVYVDMPREDLLKAGFPDELRKKIHREGSQEWIVFDNWKSEERDDRITFHIVNDKVKAWYVRQRQQED